MMLCPTGAVILILILTSLKFKLYCVSFSPTVGFGYAFASSVRSLEAQAAQFCDISFRAWLWLIFIQIMFAALRWKCLIPWESGLLSNGHAIKSAAEVFRTWYVNVFESTVVFSTLQRKTSQSCSFLKFIDLQLPWYLFRQAGSLVRCCSMQIGPGLLGSMWNLRLALRLSGQPSLSDPVCGVQLLNWSGFHQSAVYIWVFGVHFRFDVNVSVTRKLD